jgi:hypothetical protein
LLPRQALEKNKIVWTSLQTQPEERCDTSKRAWFTPAMAHSAGAAGQRPFFVQTAFGGASGFAIDLVGPIFTIDTSEFFCC